MAKREDRCIYEVTEHPALGQFYNVRGGAQCDIDTSTLVHSLALQVNFSKHLGDVATALMVLPFFHVVSDFHVDHLKTL